MNKLVLLRKGNCIIGVLGQFRTYGLAVDFIESGYPEFYKDVCQWSRFQSDEFITIDW